LACGFNIRLYPLLSRQKYDFQDFVRAFRAFRGLKEDFKSMGNKDFFEGHEGKGVGEVALSGFQS